MNNQKYTIQYCWQRLKHQLGRIFAALKFLVVTGFVALMLVITNYTELKEIVLSVLDESNVAFIKNVVNVLYGSSSVFFALEQTACLVAVPAMAAPAPAAEAEVKATQCPNCGKSVPANAKFCLDCGTRIETLAQNEIICPSCGKKTAKGKFCMECGAPLVRKCAKCGAELPNGAKFCFECGEKV